MFVIFGVACDLLVLRIILLLKEMIEWLEKFVKDFMILLKGFSVFFVVRGLNVKRRLSELMEVFRFWFFFDIRFYLVNFLI